MSYRSAKLTGTVEWSDGTPFDGRVMIGIALPTASGVDYATVKLENTFPGRPRPKWAIIPIKNGQFDQNLKVIFNADLQPPGCRYVAYFYDNNGYLIAPSPPASMFDITADPHTMSVPTLTVPTGPVTGPEPES